jgi:hypothetical protein
LKLISGDDIHRWWTIINLEFNQSLAPIINRAKSSESVCNEYCFRFIGEPKWIRTPDLWWFKQVLIIIDYINDLDFNYNYNFNLDFDFKFHFTLRLNISPNGIAAVLVQDITDW